MCYDYKKLNEDMKLLTAKYNCVEAFSIGKSVMEKDIPCLKIGTGEKRLFLSGAHHGLEYLTAAFLMRFLENYAKKLCEGDKVTEELSKKVTLYAVPMVNPDGVDIAVNGLDITNPYHRALISMVGIHSFHSVWQANARGVDVNHNYDAGWKMVMERPSPSKYGGGSAESEPETRAVAEFVRKTDFDMLLAFHSQGGEIYYDFDGMESERAEKLAEKLAEESGYAVCRPEGTAGFGGCKDWFIKEFGREGFTVEMGRGKNPLPMKMLDEVYGENERLVIRAMKEM